MLRNHYDETYGLILAMMMGLMMSISSIIVDGLGFNFSTVFSNACMIATNIVIVTILIPYGPWSFKLTRSLGLREGTIAFKLVENILPSLILNTCNTFVVSAANILYSETIPAEEQVSTWLSGAVHDWPIMLVISYFAAFIAMAVAKVVADRYAGAR